MESTTRWGRAALFLVLFGCAQSKPEQDPSDPVLSRPDLGAQAGGDDLGVDECGAVEHSASQAPAALLTVLDRSSSMAQGGKWDAARQAIVQALDYQAFDGMQLGLYAAPSSNVPGPMCILGFPVSCGVPAAPQVPLQAADTRRSGDAGGVRRQIKTWLDGSSPVGGFDPDASPLYAALEKAIAALREWPGSGKRILFVVTDGTLSCNQLSTRPGYPDGNGCDRDWEDPQNLVTLLQDANRDADKPIESFIVGVPGADTYDPTGVNYPPYRMRNALSAMAYAGAPQHVPQGCTGRSYSKTGADPAVSCHFDLTRGNFTPDSVAQAIARVRGKVVGCTFELPTPQGGGVVDKGKVNVRYFISGRRVDLFRRADRSNPCAQSGCWDYTPDGKIELLGRACEDVAGGADVKVRIAVGCATVLG